ncbi:MAG: hypothetical protein P1U89_07840 [Verrucomicrobiales bacterium]|nr:hypothetical protein [Verrucomicrobiales bacterium]
MWKILAVIAAVLLGGAGYFGLENKKLTRQKMDELSKEKDTLVARQGDLAAAKEEIASLNQSIMALQDETEKLNTEKIDFDNKVVQVASELRLLDTQIQTAEAKLERSRDLIKNFPDIEAIRRQMAEIRTEIEETEIVKVKKEGEVASYEVDTVKYEKIANELAALSKDQDAGVIRGEFQSTIAKAYNKWGFVVVNAGNDQGVVHHAQLDVYRRGQFLCKLLVTQLEANQSVADIVPGSLQPGQSVLPGDIVVKAVKTATPALPAQGPAPTPANAPASAPNAAPAGEPAPAAAPDPFGGGAAPDPFGGGGAAPDPFGGGGGGMEPDPFGGGGAPDPFGN